MQPRFIYLFIFKEKETQLNIHFCGNQHYALRAVDWASLVLNPEYSFNFETNLKHQSKNRSYFSIEKREKDRESPAFLLYISQRCNTKFLLTVWTHKTDSVALWKPWHHDWDGSVTRTFSRFWTASLINTVGSQSQIQLCKSNAMSHILWIPLKPCLDNRYMANVFPI